MNFTNYQKNNFKHYNLINEIISLTYVFVDFMINLYEIYNLPDLSMNQIIVSIFIGFYVILMN